MFKQTILYCLILIIAASAEAALKPEEIVILINSGVPDSIRIGALYAEMRKVPPDHLIKVNATTEEDMSREDYDELIAKPARKAVNALYNRGRKIRCIVTTYGIPLRIGPVKPLIVPQGEIDKHTRIIEEKNKRLALLRKRAEENKASGEDLQNEISRLRKEIDGLYEKIDYLKGSDTVAAVDSELALLLVPDYSLAGWINNPEHIYSRRAKVFFSGQLPMVSRLDAQTPELAEGLIRTAVRVERTGLYGRIYLDARGFTDNSTYGQFDEDIRQTARILEQAAMPVILDNRPGLFGPGEAPSAALYCGWYSLGRYIDAFEWNEGAVGYHVASSEAVSLHDPRAGYWVKSMIEKGVIGTLGPVWEPYLNAFPLPSLFFPLLMSGKYTLAEVFAMTNPYLSWRMILVGDPLYNPFKNRPTYFDKNLPEPPG